MEQRNDNSAKDVCFFIDGKRKLWQMANHSSVLWEAEAWSLGERLSGVFFGVKKICKKVLTSANNACNIIPVVARQSTAEETQAER